MFKPQDYELLDFGGGRKLERFGGVVVDRPSSGATGSRTNAVIWSKADSRFERKRDGGDVGKWQHKSRLPRLWRTKWNDMEFELLATASGQLGLFPEQAVNWNWITRRLMGRRAAKVLNLFAYTGGSTLAAAIAGAEVVHVDAAKSVVSRARRNAARSGLSEASIRWIVEDAPKFVKREVKRGNKYDGIILDPPSYGHGPKGEAWKLSRDLLDLLVDCKHLLVEAPVLFLLSCHTPGFGPAELSASVSTCLFGSCGAGVTTRTLSLTTSEGRKLSAGYAAYWP